MHILENPIPINAAGRAAIERALADSDCEIDYDVIKADLLDMFDADLAGRDIVGADLIGSTVEYGYMPLDYDGGERDWPRFRRDAVGWSLIGFGRATLGPADEIRIYTLAAGIEAEEDVFEVHGSLDSQHDRVIVGNAPSIISPAFGAAPARVH